MLGWRGALLVVGLPGIALAMTLALTCRDPRFSRLTANQNSCGTRDSIDLVPSLLSTVKHLIGTPSFLWMTAGASILALAGYGHGAFFASFFLRNHAEQLASLASSLQMGSGLAFLGLALGLAVGITGAIGTALGGILGDHLAVRSFRSYMIVPAVATAVGTPLTICALLVPDATAAIGLIAGASLLKSMWYGPLFASIQGLVAPRSRATAVSIFLLTMNGVGLGLGPPLLGSLSDYLSIFSSPGGGLRTAMPSFSFLVAFSALCFAMAARAMPQQAVS